MAQSHVRVMLGGLIASAALVSISAALAGPASYSEFYKHILVHKHTPLTNNMGLETVLSQSYAGREEVARDGRLVDPYERWKAMRHERLAAFRPFQLVVVVALGIAFVRVVRRVRSLWIARRFARVRCPVVELTCYYYSLFILAAILSRLRKGSSSGCASRRRGHHVLEQVRLVVHGRQVRRPVGPVLYLRREFDLRPLAATKETGAYPGRRVCTGIMS
jgi:hypothetical protein